MSAPLMLEAVARALGGEVVNSQKRGRYVAAPGPGHSHKDRSMSVFLADNEDGFTVNSFAGDDWPECKDYVRERLGLDEWEPNGRPADSAFDRMAARARAAKANGPAQPKPFYDGHFTSRGYELVAEYPYETDDGELLYQVLRYEHATEKKRFLQRRRDGNGGWFGDAGDRKVIYRWPDLKRAVHNTLFVCEGEKDADRLASLGFLATTVANGTWTQEAIEALKGYECFILEDNDDPGRKKAQKAAEALHGLAASIRVVLLPGLPEGKDVSDWLNAGNDPAGLLGLCQRVPLWGPQAERDDGGEAPQQDEWDAQANNGAAAPFPWRWHGVEEPEDTALYVIEKLVPKTGAGLISGQWGTYKTFAALDLAAAVMTATPFLGFPVANRGGVLFFAMEGQSEVTKRLTAALTARGYTDKIAPFAWIDTCPRLTSPSAWEEIVDMVESAAIHMQSEFGLPVSLAIIDTSSKAAGYTRAGDENDAALNKILTTNLSIASQKTGAFFFGVDHFGKAAETGTRGSSAKESDVDVVLALLGDKGLNGKVANPRLALRKRRNGPVGAEYEFRTRVVAVGDDDTLVIEWGHEEGGAPAKKPDRWSKSLRLLKKALVNTLIDQGADFRPFPDGPMVRGVDIEAVRSEFYKSHPAEGDAKAKAETRRKAFGRAIKDAQDKELIGVRDILRDNRDVTLVWLAGPAGDSNA